MTGAGRAETRCIPLAISAGSAIEILMPPVDGCEEDGDVPASGRGCVPGI